jgi:hypothetical protein
MFNNEGLLCYTAVARQSVLLYVCPFDFVFVTPPSPFEDFDETLYKGRPQCENVHITKGM